MEINLRELKHRTNLTYNLLYVVCVLTILNLALYLRRRRYELRGQGWRVFFCLRRAARQGDPMP